ncbi:MAG: hypothetical protein AAGD96_04640 [Chloroflexota bacterium]
METVHVTRAHLKKACDKKEWDLLNRLLDLDSTHLNDKSLYTDTWGDWWGLLLECVYNNQVDGVRVLLSHGADLDIGRWGDGIPMTPIEAAAEKPAILALLTSEEPIEYQRKSDPPLPQSLTSTDEKINRQGNIRDQTGLVFPVIDDE